MPCNVLLLSGYDAASHRLWRQRLSGMFPEFHWTQLALPPRNFNWRIRGNSLLWGFGEAEVLHQHYDLLIATSMVDLSSLRGFIPSLAQIPSIVYFHENQFVYPPGRQRSSNIEPQLVPLYAALCADAVVFNSQYNRRTFLQGAKSLFQKLPDQLPENVLHKLEASEVIPVPLPSFEMAATKATDPNILEVVWNHRWEYDKGPQLLLELTRLIEQESLPLRLHIVGEQFRQRPVEFETISKLLRQHASRLKINAGEFGFIEDRQAYYGLLRQSDVVLSTALHDFQGLAIQEASALGCTPLTPDDLVYPEYLNAEFLYPVAKGINASAISIVTKLAHWQRMKAGRKSLPGIDLQDFAQALLRPKYEAVFSRLLRQGQAD